MVFKKNHTTKLFVSEGLAKFLIYIYAFLIPFEHILEVWYGIDTIFKPYRFIALLFIGLSIILTIKKPILRDKLDLLLYGTFFIGLGVSLVNYLFGSFNFPFFLNYFIQTSLYLLVFFYSKRYKWTFKDFRQITITFVVGIMLNNVYAVITFFQADLKYLLYNRTYGFMDNPNYFALSNCTILIFSLFLFKRKKRLQNLIAATIFISSIGFVAISGSRTSLLMVVAILAMYFSFYLSSKKKIIMLFSSLSLVFILFSNPYTMGLISNTPLYWRITDTKASGGMGDDIRLRLWQGGWNAGKDTYFLGLGGAQFLDRKNFNKYMYLIDNELAHRNKGLSLHNDYLNVLIEHGFVAFIIYLAYVFGISFRLFVKKSQFCLRQNEQISNIQLLLLVSLLLFSMFSVTSLSPLYWMLLFISTNSFLPENTYESLQE